MNVPKDLDGNRINTYCKPLSMASVAICLRYICEKSSNRRFKKQNKKYSRSSVSKCGKWNKTQDKNTKLYIIALVIADKHFFSHRECGLSTKSTAKPTEIQSKPL